MKEQHILLVITLFSFCAPSIHAMEEGMASSSSSSSKRKAEEDINPAALTKQKESKQQKSCR